MFILLFCIDAFIVFSSFSVGKTENGPGGKTDGYGYRRGATIANVSGH